MRFSSQSWVSLLAIALWLTGVLPAAACTGKPPQYKGPLFDAMAQLDERADWDQAIADVKRSGVVKIALFARSRKQLGQNEAEILDLAARHAGLIVPGVPKYFLLKGDLPAHYMDAAIRGIQKYRYAFVGEILYTHGDKSHGEQTFSGERYVDPAAPGTAEFLRRLAPFKIPLMAHWEVYDRDRDWPRFDRLYGAFPDQVFILPHMGFGRAAQVRLMLRAHPNLYMTMSKKDQEQRSYSDSGKKGKVGGSLVDSCGYLKPGWKSVLLDHRSRILFATDAHKDSRWRRYRNKVKSMRRILGQLPDDAAQDLAYRNAERIYGVKISDR